MTEKRSTKRILIIVVAAMIGSIVGSVVVKKYFSSDALFDQGLMQVSNEINKTCPVMVDEETRLDNTFGGPGNRLKYNYTLINIIAENVDTIEFHKAMRPHLINVYKTSSDMREFRENNVTLIYYYRDKDGSEISQIEISPADFGVQ